MPSSVPSTKEAQLRMCSSDRKRFMVLQAKPSVFKPFPERYGHIGHESNGFLIQNLPVPDNHPEGVTAIQAREFQRQCFAREKPADRQRFKGSLAEPFLLTVNGDPVLGRQVIERGEGDDEIGSRVKPSRDSGGEKVVKSFPAFFQRKDRVRRQVPCKRGPVRFPPCAS